MKNWIAAISTLALFGFALALANTGTTPGTSASSASSDERSVMDSSTTTTPPSHDKADAQSSMPGASRSSQDMSTARTCTDENGVTFYRGKAGFGKCMDNMKKKQQSGVIGSETTIDKNTSSSTVETTPEGTTRTDETMSTTTSSSPTDPNS